MIQNIPGVGRVVPGQRINMPRKANHRRPWTSASSVGYGLDPDGNWAVWLQYVLTSGQQRTYYYVVPDEQTAQWMANASANITSANGTARRFTRGDTGGVAFNSYVRTQPLVVVTP